MRVRPGKVNEVRFRYDRMMEAALFAWRASYRLSPRLGNGIARLLGHWPAKVRVDGGSWRPFRGWE